MNHNHCIFCEALIEVRNRDDCCNTCEECVKAIQELREAKSSANKDVVKEAMRIIGKLRCEVKRFETYKRNIDRTY